jgi:hypothetical protein
LPIVARLPVAARPLEIPRRTLPSGTRFAAAFATATLPGSATLLWRLPVGPRRTPISIGEVSTALEPAGRTRIPSIASRPVGKAAPLLVAGDVESRARIAVLAARPPLSIAALAAAAVLPCPCVFRGRPELAAAEPHHRGVGMLALQLFQGREQIVALRRAERRRLPFDDDRPVGETRRHGSEIKRPSEAQTRQLNSNGVNAR